MAIATETREQAETARAVARITEAVAMLNEVARDMDALAASDTDVRCAGQIASFARSAIATADLALMVATNEHKLAQRG